MTIDVQLYQQEVSWEDAMIQKGINRYNKAVESAKKRGEEDSLKPHQQLLVSSIGPLKYKLDEVFKAVKGGKAGRVNAHLASIINMKTDVLALITVKVILGSLSKRRGFQSVARQIGNTIEDQIVYDCFKKVDKDYFNWVIQENKTSTSKTHFRFSLLGHAKNAGVYPEPLSSDTKVNIGSFLIRLMAQETGVINITKFSSREEDVITVSLKAQQYLDKMNYIFQDMFPVYMPMIVEPQDWITMTEGGYLTRSLPLVKSGLSGYIHDPEQFPEQPVVDAINAIQKTPWRINSKVMDVLNELWSSGIEQGNLPSRENIELPELPMGLTSDDEEAVNAYKESNPDAWKQWKGVRKGVYVDNRRLVSKRLIVGDCLNLAKQLMHKERFYYVYQADWRGRLYPVCSSSLQPQGADIAKGLLEFADGKPLGASGVKWLKRHIANTFGVDKVSWAEREQWVDDHSASLSLCAIDPLTYKMWLDADKGSKPWQALAACFAWEQYCREGEQAVINIPINLDGSCNGLQHLSALMLDTFGAEATNLCNHEKPADIYRLVSDRVADQVEADARIGNEIALAWEGKINRSLVKRNVMTVSYGATRFGMLEQLKEDLGKELDGKIRPYLGIDEDEKTFPYFMYVSKYIQQNIGSVVQAAPKVMDWLKECAEVLSDSNLPMRWKTPMGFKVLQAYKKFAAKRTDTIIGGMRIQVKTKQETAQMNRCRAVLAVSPNVVHSLDAAHLQATVNACYQVGIKDFCMIHDSYGTHACDVETLARLLREEFIKIYSHDWLNDIYEQFKAQAGDNAEKLPKPPTRGTFDIELVRQAGYFFA